MNVEKFISYQIEQQFPSIYLEQGEELVSFVKTYYEFLEKDIEGYYITGYMSSNEEGVSYFSEKYATYTEASARLKVLQSNSLYGDLKITSTLNQSIFHNRRMFEYGDIDSTLEKMLLFYKNKFLSGLPFTGDSIRFTVKHILDLYRRKGTTEGMQLFFRMFYSEHAHIHYPSSSILKPSTSKWKIGQYLELFPVNPAALASLVRLPIYGSISGATAIVDKINYVIISNTLVPIIQLSNVKGQFKRFDDIVYNNVAYGLVRGSLDSVVISDLDLTIGTANNFVGDIVDIVSNEGIGGRGRVTSVTDEISGELEYIIRDGGFGYTTTNTDIITSNQSVFYKTTDLALDRFEVVRQNSTGAMGYVVGQDSSSTGLFVTSSNTFITSNTSISTFLSTVNRTENASVKILFASTYNSSANAQIKTISNSQEISIIPDLIEDYLNVTIDANNYSSSPAIRPMSGNSPSGLPPITSNTQISMAFVSANLSIGTIASLGNIDPGFDYLNNTFVIARENMISRYRLSNQLIEYNPLSGVNFSIGDVVVQHDPAGLVNNKDIKGIVKAKTGTVLEVMQLSFKSFYTSNTFSIENSTTPVNIISINKNYDSEPMGLNADLYGQAITGTGKITSVEIFDSGIGFLDEAKVYMRNVNRNSSTVDATGTASAKMQGKTEGIWESKTSHLNTKKMIQDSTFYQDFSYQISSKLNPDIYVQPFKNIMHVSGTKLFHKIDIEEGINIKIKQTSEIVCNSAIITELI